VHWLAIGGAPILVAIMAPTTKFDEWLTDVDVLLTSITFG
jgi:hypothetical protein